MTLPTAHKDLSDPQNRNTGSPWRQGAPFRQTVQTLDETTLRRQARHSAAHYAVEAPGLHRPLFAGLVDTMPLGDGLILHRVDARDLQGVAVRAVLRPGLRVALTVGGKADVSFGGRRRVLSATTGRRGCGLIVAMVEPAEFIRQSRRGTLERTVSLNFSDDWLQRRFDDEAHACRVFARRHLSLHDWQPSAQAVVLAEQILAPPCLDEPLLRLYQESRSLDLAVEAFACLHGIAVQWTPGGLRPRDRARVDQIRELLESGEADTMTLEQIAQQAFLSANTLQRHFRAALGMTVFGYLRESRLGRARLALERDAVSVAQAAAIAGYSSPENFATAFRQLFGMSPRQVGRRT